MPPTGCQPYGPGHNPFAPSNVARPDLSLPLSLRTDASDYAIAGVLTQLFDGEEYPIYFVSRTHSRTKRNNTVTEECVAVLWSVQRLRGYLQEETFTAVTDHHSLLWLNNLRDPTGRLTHWNTALQMYIKFVHRKEALHNVPDALSRAWKGMYEVAAVARSTSEDP